LAYSVKSKFAVGLTGGIGSGKTTVADLFAGLGAVIIDTDAIAHALTAPGGQAIAKIAATFGPTFLTSQGAMDRAKMRELIFTDASAKQILESLLHPLIREVCEEQARAASQAYVMFVVPLLIESGTWRTRVNRVLVVDCPEELQIARVMARSSLAEEAVRAIMRSQASRQQRLAVADDVLTNANGIETLRPQVERLHQLYCILAQAQ
jgi:dephospho-CoA kinase